VSITAAALLGFAFSPSFLWILFSAVPLGLGAGSVDAALNAYVANHYKSRHMSWLHSFWGVGALSGPLILSSVLHNGHSWSRGYLYIGLLQSALVLLLFISLQLWGKVEALNSAGIHQHKKMSLASALKVKGVPSALAAFLFYCGIEATMGLWGGSYMFKVHNLDPAEAAKWVSFFYASVTAGRFVTGFLTFRHSNNSMISIGAVMIVSGAVVMLVPFSPSVGKVGFLLIGLGCAPIFPSMLHETPVRFGSENSQFIMGFQMAVAYIGTTVLPPLFGVIAGETRFWLLPIFLLLYSMLLLANFLRLKGLSE
jgi:fucose permease